ncbi:MAG: arylsulfatase A-like enzyme [Candidatus Paceibacteria bacterium]
MPVSNEGEKYRNAPFISPARLRYDCHLNRGLSVIHYGQKSVAMPKNILFITADQWRGECLSSLGHRVQTPHLDRLAAQGVLFRQHYANAVPCAPSRASIHTGMYLQNHRAGTNGTPLDARHSNWALELRQAGYDPVLFGYTDTANDPRQFAADDPVLRSYEGPLPGIRPVCMMGTYPQAWADWLAKQDVEVPEQTFSLYTQRAEGLEYEAGGAVPLPLALPADQHDTWFMVDQVIDYLQVQQADAPFNDPDTQQPFCVHLSLLRPHPPWIAPAPYNEMYAPEGLKDYTRASTPQEEAQQHPFLANFLNRKHYGATRDEKKLARLKASYFGLMSEVDANLGRLFDYLQAQDLWKDTLIVFTSDHGEQMGDHWLLGKLGYFDQSYHIPLIVFDPTQAADNTRGQMVDGFTENIDIVPTLLTWAGVEPPTQCDGKSLLEGVHAGILPVGWRTEAHWEYDFRDIPNGEPMEQSLGLTPHQCSLNVIRSNDYKYVHFTKLPPLFFDLKKDPEELHNVANDPAYLSLVLEYAQKMLSWRMNHDEQTLTHLALTDDGVVARPAPRY